MRLADGRAPVTRRMQVGWIPDYVADMVLADEEVDGFDLEVVGIHEATAEDRFTLNGGTRKHRFLPVFVDFDQ